MQDWSLHSALTHQNTAIQARYNSDAHREPCCTMMFKSCYRCACCCNPSLHAIGQVHFWPCHSIHKALRQPVSCLLHKLSVQQEVGKANQKLVRTGANCPCCCGRSDPRTASHSSCMQSQSLVHQLRLLRCLHTAAVTWQHLYARHWQNHLLVVGCHACVEGSNSIRGSGEGLFHLRWGPR